MKLLLKFWNFLNNVKLKAYSIIEVGIALCILGISITSVSMMIKSFYASQKVQTTQKKQQMIFQAIGRYTSQHGCIPYPCVDVNSGEQQECVSIDNWSSISGVGTIPWKTLGIPKHLIFDGEGNFFTYIMNPLLGKRTNVTLTPSSARPDSSSGLIMHNQSSYCFLKMPRNAVGLDSQQLDIFADQRYRNFITIRYSNTSGFLENLVFTKENACFEIADPYSHMRSDKNYACDCVAVVLISHGKTGGHFDQKGNRTEAKSDFLQTHAVKIGATPLNGDRITVSLTGPNPFDHIVAYVTRYNLNLYHGPRCKNIA